MACQSCSTSDGGAPKGCKNNGTCGTDSCNKLTVFDWLANMSLPNGETAFDCVEVRFKNGRKEYFRNTGNKTELCIVLQILIGNLNVLHKFVEVECVLALFVEEEIQIEFISGIAVDDGIVHDIVGL